MADTDVPVRKIAPGVSGGEGIKGVKRFGQDRESFENQRDADVDKLGDVEKTYRRIGAYNKGGMVKAGSPKVSAPCRDTKVISCR